MVRRYRAVGASAGSPSVAVGAAIGSEPPVSCPLEVLVVTVLEPVTRSPIARIERPLLRMRWRSLTYVHWAVEPSVVQALLPEGLTVDTHDGVTHVGLVPFVMDGIAIGLGREHGIPLPYGTFPETNVRTYVVGPDGGRGVYFHSLDVTRLAPTLVAQLGYRLPYAWSAMRVGRRATATHGVEHVAYRSTRRWPGPRGAASHLVVEVGDLVADRDRTALDDHLSARWSLYAASPSGTILRARVDHPRWPLREARIQHLDDRLVAAAGYGSLASTTPTHVRYGGDVLVQVGPPRRVG
jgi:uncharacterized protein